MMSEPEEDEPLLRGISELRDEVDRLIDAELRRREVAVQARGLVARLAQAGQGAREEALAQAQPAPVEPRAAPDGDPGKRLDILARKLEGRLRQGATTAGRPQILDRPETP
jgi:hypothetical protein